MKKALIVLFTFLYQITVAQVSQDPYSGLLDVHISDDNKKTIKEELIRIASIDSIAQAHPTLALTGDLPELPEYIYDLSFVQALMIRSPKPIALRSKLNKLKSLVAITVFYEVSYFDPKIRLDSIEHLELRYYNQSKFPPFIFGLKNLKELHLCNSKIKQIPKEIGQLQSLEDLILHETLITEIPEEIYTLKNLKTLAMCSNKVKPDFDKLYKMESLKQFYFDKEIMKGNTHKSEWIDPMTCH